METAKSLFWAEKYRPQKFDDIIGLDSAIPKLVRDDMPNLIFTGSSGTGKTTTAYAIIRKLGCDHIVLNGSDERGIDTIRHKVKEFASTRSSNGKFKIVLIDEADYLTPEAQAILRKPMEDYSKNCRFILIGNFESKIIDAISDSRCLAFRFKEIPKTEMKNLSEKILKKEGVSYNADDIDKIVNFCYPDARKMLNKLQEYSASGKLDIKKLENVWNISKLFEDLKKGKFDEIRKNFISENADYELLMKEISRYVLELKMDLGKKKLMVMELAKHIYMMSAVFEKEAIFAGFLAKAEGLLK